MSRITSSILALAIVASPLAAQTPPVTSTATATAIVLAHLSLAKQSDMSFGTHFASDGIVTSSAPGSSPAVWFGTTDVGVRVQAVIALPASLGDGAGHTAPFACGTSAGNISANTGVAFNPATGGGLFTVDSPDGHFIVSLGSDGQPNPDAGNCTVDLSGARAGTYTGQIVLTVSVI